MNFNQVCPNCHAPLVSTGSFCPNCGKSLSLKTTPITLSKQITVYLISFFLPPFGLWPGIKYLKQDDLKAKRTGLIAILLTVISLVLTVSLSIGFINKFEELLNNQSGFQDLGL